MRSVRKLLGVFVLVIFCLLCVPKNVAALEMSDEFKKILNDKRQFFAETVPPTDDFELNTLVNDYLLIGKGLDSYNISNCNSSYTLCELTYWKDSENSETHNIEVVYKYDKAIKTMIDGFINEIPAGKTEFSVRDLEIINFWVNGQGESKYLTNYSSELKEYFDYKNFSLDARQGISSPFATGRGGFANFKYNDVVYGLINDFEVNAEHIIYVSDDTENTPEAIRDAAQERITNYTGRDDIELSYVATAKDYYVSKNGQVSSEFNSFEDAFYYNFGLNGVLETDLIYILDVPIDENMGDSYELIIRRDSSKMVNPTYKTSDVATDIIITSDDSEVPLDTMVSVEALTSGDEYEKITSILKLTESLTFDLKLFSNSLNDYITRLEDGTFDVKIPVPESFKDKELGVYYVDENDEIEIFLVDVVDGYAVFNTYHFSIYTLGYNLPGVRVSFDANSGTFDSGAVHVIENWVPELYDTLVKPTREGYTFKGYFTEKTGGTKFEMILNEAGIEDNSIFYAQWELNEKNPNTFDGIDSSMFMGIISLIILASATVILKRSNGRA